MTKTFRTYILLFATAFCLTLSAKGQEPYMQQFTSKNGLPSNMCYFIFQDSKGFIWIATDAGVSRYDGVQFENFSVDAGLSDNKVLKVYEDRKGRIWFLTLNGKLSYFYKGKVYNSSNDPLVKQLSQNVVASTFLEDSKGRIWIGTNIPTVIMWDGKKIHKFTSRDKTKQLYNAYIHEDKSGVIRAYSNSAIYVFNQDDFRLEDNTDYPMSHNTINIDPSGKILYLRSDGLYQKSGAVSLIKQRISSNILKNDPGLFYSDEKEIWLSTSNGVVVLQPNSDYTVYLADQVVHQVMKDIVGNFWMATPNGIYLLPERSERLYSLTTADGLSNNVVASIQKDKQQKLWLGLDNGIIDVLNQKKEFATSYKIPGVNKPIKQLKYISKNNTLFFATDFNLGRMDVEQTSNPSVQFLKEENNATFAIKNFDIDSRGNLAFALSSGVIRLDSGIFKTNIYKLNETRFLRNRSYRVYFDKKDKLWFSNINGLHSFWNNQIQDIYKSDKLLSERINDIKELGNNFYALATDGYGIVFYKDQKIIKQITVAEGLTSNITNKLFLHKDFLWVLTNFGVHKINLKNNNFDVQSISNATELFANGIYDIYVDDQFAYLGTDNGLIYFPNVTSDNTKKNKTVYITKIEVDNTPMEISDQQIQLPIDYKSFNVQFSVVDFSNNTIMYRYRLRKDTPWINTSGNKLMFSALEPGEYNLEITARYPGEQWGNSTQLKFKIERKFFQNTWFWVAISLALTFLVFRVYVVLNRRQRNKDKLKFAMQNKILTLEQQALQALMNPHFIFNVMNAIQHYINTQEKTAANKMLTGFARLIRKNLDICSKSYITIEEELEYLNLYLGLEKQRFGEKFDFSIYVDKEIDSSEIRIPSMLVQPFVENAIWHGLMPQPNMGKVEIRLELSDDTLLLQIIDNGIGITASKALKNESHVSKGMDLTRERIRLINAIEQNSIQLDVNERPEGGTIVTIAIPI